MNAISIYDTTGQRLHHIEGVRVHDGSAWRAMIERLGAAHSIPEVERDDAIRILEDDDGAEWVFVDGVKLGRVVTTIGGFVFGEPERLTADAHDPTPQDNEDTYSPALQRVRAVLMGAE